MKKSSGSIVLLVLATTGWGCSGVTLKDADGGASAYPVTEYEDAGAPELEDDASVPFPTEDASAPFPAEDASAPISCEDAALPFPAEDASAPFCPDPPPGHAACWASCCTAAGPVATLASVADVTSALAGSWQFCSAEWRWRSLGPSDADGVEFTSDGHAYFLVQQPGGLVRGAGFAYQWSYEVESVDGTFQVLLFLSSAGGFSSAIRYSPCPRELQFDSVSLGEAGLLVPAP
jgi:hypothetical protein